MSELGDQELRGVGVEHLIDGRHHAHLHQLLDHVGAAHRHAVGELGNGDGLGQHHLADDLSGSSCCSWRFSRSRWRLIAASDGVGRSTTSLSLSRTTRPRAVSRRITPRRTSPCSRSVSLLLLPLTLGRGASPGLAGARATAGAEPARLGRPDHGRRRLDLALGLAAPARLVLFPGEQAGRGFLGASARFLFGLLARFFLGLPLDGRLFLGLAPRGVVGLALSVRRRAPAGVLLGALGVGERAYPGALFLVGERLQHHAPARGRPFVTSGRQAGRRRSTTLEGLVGRALAPPAASAAGRDTPGDFSCRLRLTSTATDLLRPWEKLWRTMPLSTVLVSSSRPAGRASEIRGLRSCSLVSVAVVLVSVMFLRSCSAARSIGVPGAQGGSKTLARKPARRRV